jgi:hypothetical protein
MLPALGVGCIGSFLLSATAIADYYIELAKEERKGLRKKSEIKEFNREIEKSSLDMVVLSALVGATCAVGEYMLYFMSIVYSPMPYK